MPLYESYERLCHAPKLHILRQIKFTTQSAVGFSTAIQSFCDLVRTHRSLETAVFLCQVLAVGGGSVFGVMLTRLWNDEDWAAAKRVSGSLI